MQLPSVALKLVQWSTAGLWHLGTGGFMGCGGGGDRWGWIAWAVRSVVSTWQIGHHDTELPCPIKARECSWVLMLDHSWQRRPIS